MTILHPNYYRIIKRESDRWLALGSNLTSATNEPVNLKDTQERYGITASRLITDLFRINGGRLGYYLANFRDKRYYYCGEALTDVQSQLLSLGIGRVDPTEGKC